MQLIRGLHNLTRPLSASVVTIGNFDGIHRGHQQVLEQLKAVASEYQLPSIVIIFEPQPIEFFAPAQAPKRLARFREKLDYLKSKQIDYLLCLKFDRTLADLYAEEFVKQILVDRLNIRHLVIGDDFRFGKNRSGDFQFLQECGEKYGFIVENTNTLLIDDSRVSSTRIRESIQSDDFEQAAKLLGRPYTLSGKIAHGKKLGRELGFPTINIKMGDNTLIVKGIFAVSVKGIDNRVLPGVASIGTRPTVDGVDTILEVFILDFDQDVYGCCVDVEFLHKIRDEEKFESLEELSLHIEQDTVKARRYFEQLN
ncbi:MAG: bifunctional riboflavin kinase/FAD synthetase [Gammaproteobacteria bacterium]|nr:MAG: bifunctional riboflavin kinase/FAD synthetase [Gammaproteobacteria bacterium]